MLKQVDFMMTLDKPWLGRNVFDRLHWGAKGRIVLATAAKCREKALNASISGQYVSFSLFCVRYDWRTIDPDNLSAGLKPYIDAMTARHKAGCGLLADDTASVMVRMRQPAQVKLKKNQAELFRSEFYLSGTMDTDIPLR